MTRKPRQPEDFLYTLQQGAESYIITKWDSIGLEMLSQYIMPVITDHMHEEVGCTCPQGQKPTCRHRKMLPLMLDRIDTNWFFRYGTGEWVNMGNLANEAAEADDFVEEPLDDESIHAVEEPKNLTATEIKERMTKMEPPVHPIVNVLVDATHKALSVPVAEPLIPAAKVDHDFKHGYAPAPTENKIPRRRIT